MNFRILSQSRRDGGFTLVEILVVMAIISILIAFAVPALEPAIRGTKLRRSADGLEHALAAAQQRAITDNTTVQFRLYKFDDPGSPGTKQTFHSYRAFIRAIDPRDQTKTLDQDEIVVIDRVVMPPPYVIAADATLSSLVMKSELLGGDQEKLSRAQSATYVEIEFRPDGSTNLATLNEPFWTLTIIRETDSSSVLPTEFVTLLLDPYNGRVKAYEL